jgi:ABC-type phosphate/phosphonate transport system permease subunit
MYKKNLPIEGGIQGFDYPRPRLIDSMWRAGGLLFLVILIAWAWSGTDFNIKKLLNSMPRMAEFFGRLVPPDMTVAKTVFVSTGETVQIALFGTFSRRRIFRHAGLVNL